MAGIYRRNGSKIWWGRAQRQGREHRRSLKTADRAIAERRLRDWLGDLDAIAWGEKPRRAFEETADRFIREHLTTIKPRAAERYGSSLKHLALQFGGKFLHQITSAALSEFETKRRTDGVKAGTIRRDLACLSSMLTSATDWEWIEDGSNPVPSYLRRRAKRGLKEANARTRYLTEDEERALIAQATPYGVRRKDGELAEKQTFVREAMTLAIDTGLRREELFALKWLQVDQARGTIATTTRTKSGRLRKVPLPTRSAQILAQLPQVIDSPYVFVNPATGERFRQLNIGFKAAARRAQLADVRWHDLRRTAGCRWLQRDGKSMEEVSILLGHSSVAVTEQRYAFLEGEAVAESLGSRTKTGSGAPESILKIAMKQ